MRVLMNVQDLGPLGGIEQHVFHTARRLADRGHRVDLLYGRDAGFAGEARSFCASTRQVPAFQAKVRHPLRGARQVWPATAAGVRSRPDVVYVNRFSELAWAAPIAAATRAPVVCHLHCFSEHKATRIRSATVHRFIAVSEALRGQWVEAGIPGERIAVVPNGVDLDAFPLGDDAGQHRARTALGLPAAGFVVLYCGRIHAEKGVDVLLEAWRALGLAPDEGRLLLVGASEDPGRADEYERRLRQASPPGCEWLPATREVSRVMQAADVVALPSRSESFGRVIVEAMATGRPVIASRVGGVPEVLDRGFERFLVTPGSAGELAAALGRMRQWRASEPDLGPACSAHVRDRFTLAGTTDQVEAVLTAASKRRSR